MFAGAPLPLSPTISVSATSWRLPVPLIPRGMGECLPPSGPDLPSKTNLPGVRYWPVQIWAFSWDAARGWLFGRAVM